MEIFAVHGHKVKVTEESRKHGHDFDTEKVDLYLEIGREYTVEYTEVGNWHTDVYLVEIPEVSFNSVNLESVNEQSADATRSHPDWKRYSR